MINVVNLSHFLSFLQYLWVMMSSQKGNWTHYRAALGAPYGLRPCQYQPGLGWCTVSLCDASTDFVRPVPRRPVGQFKRADMRKLRPACSYSHTAEGGGPLVVGWVLFGSKTCSEASPAKIAGEAGDQVQVRSGMARLRPRSEATRSVAKLQFHETVPTVKGAAVCHKL